MNSKTTKYLHPYQRLKIYGILPIFLITLATFLPQIGIAQDSDGDGVDDSLDNCIETVNPDQRDTNSDGYGNVCDADLDNNGFVSFADLDLFKSAFGTNNTHADFDGSGLVSFADLDIFKTLFGKIPGPSGSNSNISSNDAARFLNQSTFGPTLKEINDLVALGSYENWLNKQFEKPISTSQLAALESLWLKTCPKNSKGILYNSMSELLNGNTDADKNIEEFRTTVWWDTILNGQDQLRQRVAFALSEILVVSSIGPLSNSSFGLADYYDVLIKHAFGNYRDLLEEVTLHPMMGRYLSMLRNEKARPELNIRPDENFARELLQLFTIGVDELNIDGSTQQSNGVPIPTYDQTIVQGFAEVFTGWNFANFVRWNEWVSHGHTTRPMVPWAEFHDSENEKQLLNDTVLPMGQTAMEDLQAALDNVFNHPNVAPFISKQLIQRLVTSNPTPSYIHRVAKIFNNNGTGVRGDLKAVIKAILLDKEARSGHLTINDFGKLREPLLRLSHIRRTFGVIPITYQGKCSRSIYHLYPMPIDSAQDSFGQDILQSPSVFNFFLPDYSPPGAVQDAGLVAPEFQIATEKTVVLLANEINFEIQNSGDSKQNWTTLNIDREIALADDLQKLLDHLNLLLLNGQMSPEFRQLLLLHLENSVFPDGEDGLKTKVKDAIMLIVTSPDYLIQK